MKEAIIKYNEDPKESPLAIEWQELIRCKDCKHWNQYESYSFGECDIYKGYNRSGNWFCADGEKKN